MADKKKTKTAMSDKAFKVSVTNRLDNLDRKIKRCEDTILRQMAIYDAGQARFTVPSLRRIGFMVEAQMLAPKLATMKKTEATRQLARLFARYFEAEEIKKNSWMIEEILSTLESMKKNAYSSSPDSKRDVA